MSHLDQYNILNDSQHGFRKRRGCDTQLILTTSDLAASFEKNKQVDAVLLDFSKAFDRVPHSRL
jgi:tRNA A58 N-methylase Trm61